ncbi:MAG: hypothetical protein OXH70_08010 [Acidobacteria bacterium]|nr:hypothetical protein [Acidobacteriota bacterium]
MKPLTFLVALLLLLGGGSAASASTGLDTAINTAIPKLSLDGVSPLTLAEMSALTGSAPSWVQAGCAAIGGFTGGRGAVRQIAKQLGKRVVISTVCPVCGTAITIAAVGCLFF